MSFREKSAWISFVSILLVFSIYFAQAARVLIAGESRQPQVHLILVLVLGLVALEVVLHVAIAIQSPREARSPKDERERLIDLKATRVAFPVLLIGALCAILPVHLGGGRGVMVDAILLAVVVAELVKFGAQIVYYRRGF
jgi:hypothetical protein